MKKIILGLMLTVCLITTQNTVIFAIGPNDVFDGDNDIMEKASQFRYPITGANSIGGPPKTLSENDKVDWYKFKPGKDGKLKIIVDANKFGPEHEDYDFNPDLNFNIYLYNDYGQRINRGCWSSTSATLDYTRVYDDRFYYLEVKRIKGSGQYYISTYLR
ncbi:hypothetical protein [Vallitalea sp.]|jgi:hypothetical protein|uniref:hypothetical protein n=1 Tax=Vallitalea sp. TaxID=1882829 RepID=UPI0025DD0181|nr:hypothetical protein [Vallitalea sp.]MCT4687298.1 hypothetical protein [Vallitalea sp.]